MGWVVGTVVKMLFGMPSSHIGVPQLDTPAFCSCVPQKATGDDSSTLVLATNMGDPK